MTIGTTVTTEKMFEMMMASMGLSMAGIAPEVVTNMIDEVDEFATDNGYHFDGGRDVYLVDAETLARA